MYLKVLICLHNHVSVCHIITEILNTSFYNSYITRFKNMIDTQHNNARKVEKAKTLSIKGQNPLPDMQVLPAHRESSSRKAIGK